MDVFYSLALPSHVARPVGSEEWPSCCPDALRVWEPTCRTWIPSLQFRWQYTTTAYCTTNEARADSAGGCCKKNAGEWLFYWYDVMTGSWACWQVQTLVACAVFGSNWLIGEKILKFSCYSVVCSSSVLNTMHVWIVVQDTIYNLASSCFLCPGIDLNTYSGLIWYVCASVWLKNIEILCILV